MIALVISHIGDIAQFITAIVLAATFLQNRKIASDVREVKHATNSLTDRLVETTRIEAHAAGMKEQRESES